MKTLQQIEAQAVCKDCARCDPKEQGLCCQNGSGLALKQDILDIANTFHLSEEDTLRIYFDEIERFGTKFYQPKQHKIPNRPHGPCIFFAKGIGCTIYSVRPTQCRIGTWGKASKENLQWFFDTYAVKRDIFAEQEYNRFKRCA